MNYKTYKHNDRTLVATIYKTGDLYEVRLLETGTPTNNIVYSVSFATAADMMVLGQNPFDELSDAAYEDLKRWEEWIATRTSETVSQEDALRDSCDATSLPAGSTLSYDNHRDCRSPEDIQTEIDRLEKRMQEVRDLAEAQIESLPSCLPPGYPIRTEENEIICVGCYNPLPTHEPCANDKKREEIWEPLRRLKEERSLLDADFQEAIGRRSAAS